MRLQPGYVNALEERKRFHRHDSDMQYHNPEWQLPETDLNRIVPFRSLWYRVVVP